ncbi:hypothetical protein [Amedibacillus sp. YH-ame10]
MKKLVIIALTVLCCIPLNTVKLNATGVFKSIVLFADAKEWRYKIVDGQIFKRLYNLSKERWEGSWIKVT